MTQEQSIQNSKIVDALFAQGLILEAHELFMADEYAVKQNLNDFYINMNKRQKIQKENKRMIEANGGVRW